MVRKHVNAKKEVCFDMEFLSLAFTLFSDELRALVTQNHALLQTLSSCVEKYLDNCGRRWVDLGTIFSRLSSKPRPQLHSIFLHH